MPYSIHVNLQIKKKKKKKNREMWITNCGTVSCMKCRFPLFCWVQNHTTQITEVNKFFSHPMTDNSTAFMNVKWKL